VPRRRYSRAAEESHESRDSPALALTVLAATTGLAEKLKFAVYAGVDRVTKDNVGEFVQ
jgi:hypothetical protein